MTKNTVEPWNDERVIAEAETIAASYVTLDDDQRRILRSEIIGVLRRQAIAEGQHCESRAEARQAQIERLRAQLDECEQWDSVGIGEIKDDIGLCAAGIVLAYHRKTHEHITKDDDTFRAALRVEHWLGRR